MRLPDEMRTPEWFELTPEQQAAVERFDEAVNEEYREHLQAMTPEMRRRLSASPFKELREQLATADRIVGALARGAIKSAERHQITKGDSEEPERVDRGGSGGVVKSQRGEPIAPGGDTQSVPISGGQMQGLWQVSV